MKIMVVDDNSNMRALLVFRINQCGFDDVVTFNNPKIALKWLSEGHLVDALISDFNMPGMNGIEFLREATRWLAVPMAVCSSMDRVRDCPEHLIWIDKLDYATFEALISNWACQIN